MDGTFQEVLNHGYTTNASGRSIFTLSSLSDADLVSLYDLTDDYGDLVQPYGEECCSIADRTIYSAVLDGFEEMELDEEDEDYAEKYREYYEACVEFLRSEAHP